jgi:nucleotide-binding universal stress UspA family protein
MFKRVLAATDTLGFCDEPIQLAAKLSENNRGNLIILHILESGSTIYRNFVRDFRTGEEIVTNAKYERQVHDEIKQKCDGVLGANLNYKIYVTPGFPWTEIAKCVRKENIDLIVMGPRSTKTNNEDIKRVTGKIGSTSEGVIRHVQCPVMFTNGPISEGKLRFKKLLVPVDFSESCKYAIDHAIKLAHLCNSIIYFFHMAPESQGEKYVEEASGFSINDLRKQLVGFCQEIFKDIDLAYVVRKGIQPHFEILKLASEKDADLIIMGSHTKETEGKWRIGSTAGLVSCRSNSPVVVISDPNTVPDICTTINI